MGKAEPTRSPLCSRSPAQRAHRHPPPPRERRLRI